MQQQRLLLALLISTAILLGWYYLFPVKPPQRPNPGNQTAAASPSPTTLATPGQTAVAQTGTTTASSETNPRRAVTITTPLYVARIDSQGAVVTSWILKKNKESKNNQPLRSAGGDKNHPELELISQKGLEHQPREAPLKVFTGDAGVDDVINSRNYEVQGVEGASADAQIDLSGNEKKSISFSLKDNANNIDVTKTITFDPQSYSAELKITIKRGVAVPQVKLQIGPSIGDQGIKNYSFYSVAPEAIASVSDKVERYAGNAINENKASPDRVSFPGEVDWAGVGDTYFAMVAVPSRRLAGLDFTTSEYDYQNGAKPEKRFLTRALVPVPADGSPTILYVGPKDHYLLQDASQSIGAEVGRKLDLEGLINYGWLGSISRPIAVPILWCITKLHDLTGSYGVAIILFTIIIYSAFFPLKWRSSKAMKKAQKLAPRMKELQEKIKGMKQSDPRLKELQMEQLRLMKEGNPLGGCLPLLIQMPFLFALYRAITISLDFRQATFLWLPDLSAPEPYLIHVLPILMAVTMIVLQLITPAPSADPLQRKMMAIGMPLFMLYVLWGAPAGLLVYWLVGNIVGFSQQFLINRYNRSEDDEAPPTEKTTETRSRKKVGAARVSQA
jgi:YidC/Oxa1 family membrane protein insertase